MARRSDRPGRIGRPFFRKVFPDHWSFLLGEIALYSFIVLLLSGVFLTIWFKPSMSEVEYQGSYELLRGITMSDAYASTLNLSFDIRGGLLLRQMHHWAAMLFVAAMLTHSLRIFFTGAFRKPREINWLIGVALIGLGLVEGFAGYSLPDDLLSGTGLRFVDGLIRAIPLIGTWAEFFVFGGEFPGELIIPRLYMVHILLTTGVDPRAHRGAPGAGRLPQAHPIPRPRPDEWQCGRLPGLPGVRRESRRLLPHRLRRPHLDGRDDADQPGVGVRAVQPSRDHRRLAARLVHGLRRGRDSHHAELGMAHWLDDVVVERLPARHRGHDAVFRDHGHLSIRRGLGDGRQA